MARDKVQKVGTHRTRIPIGIQDGTGLIAQIIDDLTVNFFGPFETRITNLENAVAQFVAGEVQSVEIDLPRRRSGQLKVAGLFLAAQVGAPVLVGQGSPLDDLDGVVLFAGQVLDTHTLQIVWQSASLPPRRVRINYIIGNRQE
jgi:hypothetical protein